MTDRYDISHLPEDQYEPGSNGTVLRNLLGITSREELEHVEEVRFERLMEEAAARFDVDHHFTAQDILWLHKFWFDGVFSWAGAYRTVNIGKGGFMFAAAAHVPALMRQFESDQLARLSPCRFERIEDVVAALAEVHVELVLIHPFREGNGRIARLLSVLMALQAGLPPLDFSEVQGTKRDEYFAAVQAGMDRDYQPMERIFSGVIERTLSSCGR
jgi:cell filamentation protein